ncbi:hypothetical protein BH23ACT10_BH23ACT10_18640 [soil metagenome]
MLAAVLAWTAITRLGVRPGVAVAVAGVFAAGVPLAPYGTQVYPEVPAALAVAVAIAALLGTPRASTAVIVGLACCALPWLGIKYTPVAAVLAAVALRALWRAGRRRSAGALVAAVALAGAGYLVVHQLVWTGWTVYASADHFVATGQLSVVGVTPDHWARTTRLVGLLVERSFGIAAWQPAWLLSVAAAAAVVRVRPPGWRLLLVVVLPAAVLLRAWWADRHAWVARAVVALGVVGVAAWLLLAWEASTGDVTLVIDFFDTTNPLYQAWRVLLPDYLAPSAATWWRHAGWLVALTGLALVGWRSATPAVSAPATPRHGADRTAESVTELT